MLTIDPFKQLASTYDKMPRDELSIAKFFGTLIERHGIRSVLDCACGTGSDLVTLHSLCTHVFGSDISNAMLEQARRKLADHNLNIPLAEADFRYLPQTYGREFDMLICMSTSLPQVPDEANVKAALTSMRSVLSSGGILVIGQGLTDKLFHTRRRFIPILNSQEHTRIMVVDYLAKHWRVHVLDCIRSEPDPGFQAHTFEYLTLLEDDYRRLLAETAFTTVEIYGNYDLTPYDRKTSDNMIIVAHA